MICSFFSNCLYLSRLGEGILSPFLPSPLKSFFCCRITSVLHVRFVLQCRGTHVDVLSMQKVNQHCIKHVCVSGPKGLHYYFSATCVVSVVQNSFGTLKSFVSHHKYVSVTHCRNCTLEGFFPFLHQHKISYNCTVLNETTRSLLVFVRHSPI